MDNEPNRAKPQPILAVRDAATEFLRGMLGVEEVGVTRVARSEAVRGAWDVEAEALVPNTTIRALGLPVSRDVFDRKLYAIQVDSEMQVVSFEQRFGVDE